VLRYLGKEVRRGTGAGATGATGRGTVYSAATGAATGEEEAVDPEVN